MKAHIGRIIVAIIAFLLVGGSYAVWQKNFSGIVNEPEPVACTLDAKICPDGTAVGRTGPNCEFAACPIIDDSDIDVWLKSTNVEQGVSFEYPNTITTEFVKTVDWPPQIQIVDSPFTCTEAGVETSRAGMTQRETVNGRTYCVTKVSEGAAGSTYVNHTYAFPFGSKTAIFTFSIRFPQCSNYDEPQATGCKLEQADFKPINQADRMAQTVKSL